MVRTSPMENEFISIRKELFELVDMVEIRIDVGYILEIKGRRKDFSRNE